MSELRTLGDPVAVEHSLVVSVLQQLGIENWRDVAQVLIQPRRIIVTRNRRDEDGYVVLADDTAATDTTIIAVRRDES